ncbi:MAG: methyltransferase domain-containing protein, partial [Armatimonadota bacterium]|nr:methyltransferase domain-containing protein [Armatimonadota bacterium]
MIRRRPPRSRLTARALERLHQAHATTARTLIVHPYPGIDYARYFPNALVVTWERHVPAHVYVDRHYLGLGQIPASSFAVVICIGVLEHVPDPQRFVDDCCRILQPDGKLVLSASAVFPF